jgi:hypothetical protein
MTNKQYSLRSLLIAVILAGISAALLRWLWIGWLRMQDVVESALWFCIFAAVLALIFAIAVRSPTSWMTRGSSVPSRRYLGAPTYEQSESAGVKVTKLLILLQNDDPFDLAEKNHGNQ